MALDVAYDEALCRINSQKAGFQELAIMVLSWIVCAARQLSALELQYALGVEEGSSEFDEENLPEVNDIISVCAGLVTVDEISKVIRLVHYTTQDYLERTLVKWAPNAQSVIARTCLTYLSYDNYPERPRYYKGKYYWQLDHGYDSVSMGYLFLQYALNYWHFHTERCSYEFAVQECLPFLAMKRYITVYHTFFEEFTDLQFAAYYGLKNIVSALLGKGDDPCVKDSNGYTPLFFAAQNGHQNVVELILTRKEIDINGKDDCGATPLHHAAGKGHENIVQLLLAHDDIEPDTKTSELLFAHDDIEPNTETRPCETPLHWASRKGHKRVVQLLVERDDVDINSQDMKNILVHRHRKQYGGGG